MYICPLKYDVHIFFRMCFYRWKKKKKTRHRGQTHACQHFPGLCGICVWYSECTRRYTETASPKKSCDPVVLLLLYHGTHQQHAATKKQEIYENFLGSIHRLTGSISRCEVTPLAHELRRSKSVQKNTRKQSGTRRSVFRNIDSVAPSGG